MPILQILIGLFLIAHGLVHALYAIPRPPDARNWPFSLSRSWLLGPLGLSESVIRGIGLAVIGLTILSFFLVGLAYFGLFGLQAYWTNLVMGAAIVSLCVLILFWNTQLVFGVIIDVALLYLVFIRGWKP